MTVGAMRASLFVAMAILMTGCGGGGSSSGGTDDLTAVLEVTASTLGTISSAGGEIDCGTTCTFESDTDIDLNLTAEPDDATAYEFDSWTGCTSASGSECTVSVAVGDTLEISASFAAIPVDVAVLNVTVNTGGYVTTIGDEIDCGDTCSYESETAIDLTLTPTTTDALNYEFDSWTNCPALDGDDCLATVAVGETLDLTANFNFIGTVSGANILTDWIFNTTGEVAAHIGGGSTLVNVQDVTDVEYLGEDAAYVDATGIPDYNVVMTQELVDALNARQNAATDFFSGETSAVVGEDYDFGESIGYNGNPDCPADEGLGYWPPGPDCPEDKSASREIYLPQAPVDDSAQDCVTGIGAVGYAVNGVSIFAWTDGMAYATDGTWANLAAFAEKNDVDICGGHAANGEYHHHFYSDCWAAVAGEDFDGHSELYGYAADGYPVYGPYEDTDLLAKTCWAERDYDGAGTAEGGWGCVGTNGGTAGDRTCVLDDQYDPTGVEAASTNGPNTSDTVETLSGNEFTAVSGYYFEDYYFDTDCAASSDPEVLDVNGGHTDAERGYHYHLPLAEESSQDGTIPTPAFPFVFGPRYKGDVDLNGASCGVNLGGGGGPPGM